MELRWTEEAAADLERIADYLFERTPTRAPSLMREIYNATATLVNFLDRGRPGRKKGTRELVVPSLPYVVVYRISGDAVHIVRILHGAQKWP